MATIKTLAVDDEFLALNLLENFIGQTPDLELVSKERNPLEALKILHSQSVDLLFLDIQMPSLSGNNLLKSLHRPPVTIFTTAYSEYATEAFDLNAVDYLLKPFSFERFLQAVNKAKDQLELRRPALDQTAALPVQEQASTFFTAKVDGKIQKIYYREILFIEGMKEYVRVHCTSGRYVILERLHYLEAQLPAEFVRVHKSYIVAKHQVQSLEGNLLQLGPHKIPLSRSRREEVLRAIFEMD